MGYSISYIPEFEGDYDEVLNYLAREQGRPQAAIDFMDAMDAALDLLMDNPYINAISLKPHLAACECRVHHVGGYALVYAVRDEAVVMIGLFHQRQMFDGIVSCRG